MVTVNLKTTRYRSGYFNGARDAKQNVQYNLPRVSNLAEYAQGYNRGYHDYLDNRDRYAD